MDGLNVTAACGEPGVAGTPALIARDETLSHAALAARVAHLRAALAARGVEPGSRVALVASNRVATVVAVHALLELGASLVPIHPRLTPAEAQVLLDDATPALALTDDALDALGEGPAPATGAPSAAVPEEADLAILYTSGTTGRPKGAVLPRAAFVAAAAASAANLGWQPGDRWLLCMPLCHVGGLSIVTRCLLARRAVVLEPRFDPDGALDAIARHACTLLSVVPTMLAALLERDRRNVLARLRAVLVGGAAAPLALLEQCAARAIPALATYGLTEACSQVTAQRLSRPLRARPGSGWPLPSTELRIAGPAVAPGEVGRILVRGASLMRGYWRGPSRPPEPAVDAAGWFDTGDLGSMDPTGALTVHTRRTDLIVTGGENVYPVEIEQAIEAATGRRALVFGVPDERWGQVVAVAVERGAPPDDAAWDALLRSLAPHKRPRRACTVPALPFTASGKLDRSAPLARFAPLLRPWTHGPPE